MRPLSISDGIAVVAVIVAFVSLYRTRKQVELESKLNETASKLTQLQLEILQREEEERSSADIAAYFYLDSDESYRVAVVNIGQAAARDVTFQLNSAGENRSILVADDASEKFPASSIRPGEEICLLASLTLDMAPNFTAITSWKNPNGKLKERQFQMSLPG